MKIENHYENHDENNTYKMGETVKIIESRPISKTKKWVVEEKEGAKA